MGVSDHRWETYPVTADRFDDLAAVINPNRRATHCWCLSHRLGAADLRRLEGEVAAASGQREPAGREAVMRALCAADVPPGVVTYRDGVPVGWCHVSPRAQIPRLVSSTLIRPVDDVAVWSIICLVVRSGHCRQGVSARLLAGAVAWAFSQGAPAVEAYPVDPPGRIDTTMGFVGVRAMFDRAGFEVIGTTDAVAARLPRLVMRLNRPTDGATERAGTRR